MRRIIVLLLAVAALLPACGAPAEEASASERIAQASTTTRDAGSAKVAMNMEMLGGAQDVNMTAEGAIDFATQQSQLTMDLGALAGQTGMGQVEMRTDGTTIYMKLPNAQQLGVPTPWVKMDTESMAGMQGLGQMPGMNNTDPTSGMEMLRGVSDDIEEVGTEDIRGTSATHYKATVDLNKAIEEAPDEAKQQLQTQLETLGTETIPVDIWIDDEGRVVRQDTTMDLSKAEGAAAAGGAAPTEVKVSVELFDFGTEVDVAPPPESEVTDFAELQGGGGG